MKHLKTLISLVLIVCICQGMLFTVSAAETSASPLDTWENNLTTIKSILSGRMVMVVDSPKYFLDGKASHYDNTSDEAMSKVYPLERGNSAIVPAKTVAKEFSYSLSMNGNTGTFTKRNTTIEMTAGSTRYTKNGTSYTAEVAPEIVNGILYVPIKAFTDAIGWSLYTDLEDSGLIIVGDDSNPFNTIEKAALKAEIARATRYERPEAATVIADMEAFQNARIANGDRAHPRIHITDSRIDELKTQIKDDEFTAKIYEGIKKAALSNYNVKNSSSTIYGETIVTIKNGIPQYNIYYGNESGRIDWQTWIETMMLVYWIEGEPQEYEHYLQRSKDILLSMATWPDYGLQSSLSVSASSVGLSIGYDWLYNYLTEEEKATVKEALITKCMEPDLSRYNYTIELGENGLPIQTFHRWPTWGNNFTSAGNEGVVHAIVAVWDEGDEERALSTEMLRYMFRSQELALDFLLPDGGGNEGLGYLLGGSVSESANVFLNIINATGKNYGYLQSRSYKDALENLIYMEGAEGLYSFGDEDWRPRYFHEPKEDYPLLFWMGQHISPIVYNYRKDVLENYLDAFNSWRNMGFSPYDLLYYDTDFVPEEQELALGKYYRGTEYIGVRESWDKMPDRKYQGGYVYKDNFLGFKAGLGQGTHTHHDMGSFIWDAAGIRWFGDGGRNIDAYNTNGTVIHDAIYSYRAEGHNVFMFRNADDLTSYGKPTYFSEDGYYLLMGDDFEQEDAAELENWNIKLNSGTTANVVADSNKDYGNVLNLKAGSDGTSSSMLSIEFPNGITGKAVVEYDIKVNEYEDDNYSQYFGIYLNDANNKSLGWKQIGQVSKDKFNNLNAYDQDQWYHMKVVFDFAAGTYTKYIGDTKVADYVLKDSNSNQVTNTSATSIVFSTIGTKTLDCNIDNLMIYADESNIDNIYDNNQISGKTAYYLLKGDNFETSVVGAVPDWDVSTYDGAVIEIAKDTDVSHGNVVHMKAGSGTKDSRFSIDFNPNSISNNMTLEFDIKVNSKNDATDSYNQLVGLYMSDTQKKSIGWKQFVQVDNEKLFRLYQYNKGQWYNIKVEFDFANGTYSTYVDGVHKHTANIKHNDQQVLGYHADSLVFSTMGSTTLDYYIDNIEIYVDESNGQSILDKKSMDSDQSTATVSEITKFINSPGSAFGIADLSEVYGEYSRDYKRGAGLFGNREYVVIRDEAVVAKDCETYWFGHTLADIELVDGKNAILTDSATGKRAWVGIVSDGPETFSTMPARRFPETSGIHDDFENTFKNNDKLTIESNRSTGEEIALTVMMKALDEGEAIPTYDMLPDVKYLSLSQWSADNTPLINGGFVEGIEEGTYALDGNVTMANGGKILPIVAAYDGDTNELLGVSLTGNEEELQVNLPRDLSVGIKIPDAKLEKGGKVTLKAFIWDGVEKLTPYSTFFEKVINLPAKAVPTVNEIPAEEISAE